MLWCPPRSWWLWGGLRPPGRADASPQGMLTADFVSAGTARTHGATGPPRRAGNILVGGRWGAATWSPHPLVLQVGGVWGRDVSSPCCRGGQGTSLGQHPPPSPSSLLSLQGRHGLPGPPGPPGPQGLPGESVERPGKKGDRVSTSDPLTHALPGPWVQGCGPTGPLSALCPSLFLLLTQAEGGSLVQRHAAPSHPSSARRGRAPRDPAVPWGCPRLPVPGCIRRWHDAALSRRDSLEPMGHREAPAAPGTLDHLASR